MESTRCLFFSGGGGIGDRCFDVDARACLKNADEFRPARRLYSQGGTRRVRKCVRACVSADFFCHCFGAPGSGGL